MASHRAGPPVATSERNHQPRFVFSDVCLLEVAACRKAICLARFAFGFMCDPMVGGTPAASTRVTERGVAIVGAMFPDQALTGPADVIEPDSVLHH
jgi:hypothetical protein